TRLVSDWSSDVCSSDLVVVIGLLDPARNPVHAGEDETADQVISGHFERRRAGCIEINIVIVLLDTAEFEVVAKAESHCKTLCGSPFILNISRIIRVAIHV